MQISQTKGYFGRSYLLEEVVLFLLALKRNLQRKCFPVLRQKPTQILPENLLKGVTIQFY